LLGARTGSRAVPLMIWDRGPYRSLSAALNFGNVIAASFGTSTLPIARRHRSMVRSPMIPQLRDWQRGASKRQQSGNRGAAGTLMRPRAPTATTCRRLSLSLRTEAGRHELRSYRASEAPCGARIRSRSRYGRPQAKEAVARNSRCLGGARGDTEGRGTRGVFDAGTNRQEIAPTLALT